MLHPTLEEFAELARRGNLVPVYRELPADLETPVSVYLKLRARGAHVSASLTPPAARGESFLLESVEGGEQLARYSFIGISPARVITLQNDTITLHDHQDREQIKLNGSDPLDVVRAVMQQYRAVAVPGLPRFFGGAVGFLSYDMVRRFERIRPSTARTSPAESAGQAARVGDEGSLPDAILLLADTLIAFDHVKHRALVIANALVNGDPVAAYDHAVARIDTIVHCIQQPLQVSPSAPSHDGQVLESNISPEEFAARVRRAQEHIAAGDIFQVVLSQRFQRDTTAEPFSIYRALRRLNPSPYMFFLDLGETQFVGSSPEMLVRLEGDSAQLNPIAGTRPRGANADRDAQLEQELCADPKERAEHVMLVDLGRNDLGRVCEFGSVQVPDFMSVQRYSHVMHLVSRVTGKLRAGLDAFDLLRATFPAGTVSGAPKIRAMEIIDALEPTRRGPYAGAVGYFGFPTQGKGGNMDFCITIRTIVMRGRRAFIQAGAGIVADSVPRQEHRECVNKARALAEAIRMAEEEP